MSVEKGVNTVGSCVILVAEETERLYDWLATKKYGQVAQKIISCNLGRLSACHQRGLWAGGRWRRQLTQVARQEIDLSATLSSAQMCPDPIEELPVEVVRALGLRSRVVCSTEKVSAREDGLRVYMQLVNMLTKQPLSVPDIERTHPCALARAARWHAHNNAHAASPERDATIAATREGLKLACGGSFAAHTAFDDCCPPTRALSNGRRGARPWS